MDTEVVDALVRVVTENFDISRKYYTLKAKLLGQKQLGYHERNVPIGKLNNAYDFDTSIKLVEDTFKDIDPLFASIVKNFLENGQYDVYPKEGKSDGAYCIGFGNQFPTFLLLNHSDRLKDVLTIAHESGHGIHTELSKKQTSLNSGYPTSLAEVASTFFEDFVLMRILKDLNKEEALSLMHMKLNGDISTIFRQVAFYNFEKELHNDFREKGFLSKEYISDLFCKHMKAYLGDAVAEDDNMRNGWIYVSHFRTFFYVYSYASGLLISKSLQASVKENHKFVENVKKFLESGSTKSPKVLFGEMGIDLTNEGFWKKGIQEINELLEKIYKLS
jgi:oligoendopeptidase F